MPFMPSDAPAQRQPAQASVSAQTAATAGKAASTSTPPSSGGPTYIRDYTLSELSAELFASRIKTGRKARACDSCRRERRKCHREPRRPAPAAAESSSAGLKQADAAATDDDEAPCAYCRKLGVPCTRDDPVYRPGRKSTYERAILARLGLAHDGVSVKDAHERCE